MKIRTASWFAPLPADHIRIGISRGSPRGMKAGYRLYRTLAPGDWFKTAGTAEYLDRYGEILAALNPQKVADDLAALAGGQTPVMVCYESIAAIESGEQFCHRHLAAKWLQDNLGIEVDEVGASVGFDAFTLFKLEGIDRPVYA